MSVMKFVLLSYYRAIELGACGSAYCPAGLKCGAEWARQRGPFRRVSSTAYFEFSLAMRPSGFGRVLALLGFLFVLMSARAEPAGQLTLREALATALRNNPELAAYDWDVRAAEARILQAGLRPNPEISLQAEDVTGTGPYETGEEAERTLQLSQLVELGGKRPARVREAITGRGVTEWDYQVKRVEVLREVTQGFIEVLSAQRRLSLTEEVLKLAEEQVPVSEKRVAVGRTSPVEVTRANVAVASARIAVDQARRDLATAQGQLAAQLGARSFAYGGVTGDLDHVEDVPSLASLTAKLFRNPQLARWATERERREAALLLQRSQAVPDITVMGGPRVIGKGEDLTIGILGVSVPLPLFNRNQGNIAEAQANLSKVEAERQAAENRAFADLNTAYQSMARAAGEAATLREQLIPQAAQAIELLTEGYIAGRFSQIEILDARRTLTEARIQHLRALGDYHKARAAVDALTAAPVELNRQVASRGRSPGKSVKPPKR